MAPCGIPVIKMAATKMSCWERIGICGKSIINTLKRKISSKSVMRSGFPICKVIYEVNINKKSWRA
jgi:hypothetical protein